MAKENLKARVKAKVKETDDQPQPQPELDNIISLSVQCPGSEDRLVNFIPTFLAFISCSGACV